MLIGAGAYVDLADVEERTPLYVAASNGHETAAKVNPQSLRQTATCEYRYRF